MTTSRLKTLTHHYLMAAYELKLLRQHCYPNFVFDSTLKKLENEIPVFLFHSVKYYDFEEKLAYLVKNGYHTIGADELHDCLIGKRKNARNTIVLTFDDGRASLWSIAYPLLKKYGLVGIAFIVPNWISKTDQYYQNLGDYWEGRASFSDIETREYSSHPIITWHELKEMEKSGNIDVQSHTLNHSMIFTSNVIVDFVNPTFNFGFFRSLVPIFHVCGQDDLEMIPPLGTPIYTTAPRVFGTRRYYDDEDLRNACISFVKESGENDFFKRRHWRKQLQSIVQSHREKNILKDRYESDAEREEAILSEFRQSKAILDEHLHGKSVNHLCFPFFAGTDLSVKLSQRSGYLSNFWGWDMSSIRRPRWGAKDPYMMGYGSGEADIIRGRRTNKIGDDPYKVVRLPADYIFRLPGKGRRSIQQIMVTKCLRNLKKNKATRSI